MNCGKNAPRMTNSRYQTKNATVMGNANERYVRRSSVNSSDCWAARNCSGVGAGGATEWGDMGAPSGGGRPAAERAERCVMALTFSPANAPRVNHFVYIRQCVTDCDDGPCQSPGDSVAERLRAAAAARPLT